MTKVGRKATLFNIAANFFLFILKFAGGLISGSLALMSDAVNSFSDTVYSIAIFFAVRTSHKSADADHPFGHHRAEPVASLLVAMLAGVLGAQIIKTGIDGLMSPQLKTFSLIAVGILAFTMLLKSGMWLYFRLVAARINSPALKATSIDCRNDVLVSSIALVGVFAPVIGFQNLDYWAAMVIGAVILFSGYRIGIENLDYLMGKTPDKRTLDEIRKRALSVGGVVSVHDIKAHYVGNYIHVQVHAGVGKDLSAIEAHDIGDIIEAKIEEMPSIDKVFVHMDPHS